MLTINLYRSTRHHIITTISICQLLFHINYINLNGFVKAAKDKWDIKNNDGLKKAYELGLSIV